MSSRRRRGRRGNGGGNADSKFIQGARSVERIGREINHIRKLLNVEEKNIDVDSTFSVPVGTPLIYAINLVGQGDTAQQRNGNSIKILRTKLKVFISTTSASTPNTFVRVMLIRDKQANGALPSITDILSTNLLQSFRSVNTEKRFVIHYDRTYAVDVISDAQVYDIWSTETPCHVEFTGTGAGISDISTNSMLCVVLSNTASNHPTITLSTRVRFLDN